MQIVEEPFVPDRDDPGQQFFHRPADQSRGAADGQAVCSGLPAQADVPYGNRIVQAGSHPKQHAGSLRGLNKVTENVVFEFAFQSECDPARRSADTAWNINKERMFRIYGDLHLIKLFFQAARGDGISQEQRGRVLIIHKVAEGILRRLLPAFLHGFAVIGSIFDDLDAFGTEQVLFPLAGIRRHVHRHAVTDCSAHDADTEPQISCGTDMNGVLPEERPGSRRVKYGIIVFQNAVRQCQFLGVLQDFVNAAPGFHRSRDRKMAVLFQQELPFQACMVLPVEEGLHRRDLRERRFNDPVPGSCLRKASFYERGKPGKPLLGIINVRFRKRKPGLCQVERRNLRVFPDYFPAFLHVPDQCVLT